MSGIDVLDEEHENVSALKTLPPTQVVEIVKKLRTFLGDTHSLAFTLYSSFEDVDRGAEREAKKTRHTLELAVARVAALLTEIEKSPHYHAARTQILKDRQ